MATTSSRTVESFPSMLRHSADWRTALWAFVLFPALGLRARTSSRGLIPWLLPLSLYFGFCAGVFSHNHNHCPMFKSRKMNAFYSAWLSVFYGYPTFAWIPTHNLNHHKFVNKAGDATITWRYSKRNTWLIASTYYFVSAYWQSRSAQGVHRQGASRRTARSTGRSSIQCVTLVGVQLALLALGWALHGLVAAGRSSGSSASRSRRCSPTGR